MAVARDAKVGVLLGGWSSEREVSLATGAAVAGALRDKGWDVVTIDAGPDLATRLVDEGVDVAWIALHGRGGEDGCVQGLLEVLRIPYTGSGVMASAVAMDKIATKRMLRGVPGLVMAEQVVARAGDPWPADLGGAVIVKPSVGGSTVGMQIVEDPAAWDAALAAAIAEHPEVLVEEVVRGEEITVAVLDGRALPVVRIIPESGFFDFAAKYEKGKTVYEVPAALPDAVVAEAQRAAVAAYEGVGCRGLARADFLVRADGTPVFLEINTLPGMTATSLSPMAAGSVGIDFATLCEKVLQGARLGP